MITNFLLDHAALVPVALLAVAAACVGIGYLVLGNRPGDPRPAWSLAALTVVPVVVLTLLPTGRTGDRPACTVQFAWPSLGSVELLANVALLLPPAFFATLATGRPGRVLVAAAAGSALIESVQAVVPAIGRACDTNDWLMNTTGSCAGVVLALATAALARRRSRTPS